jgi:UDP-N-acetylglucosamine acyltransferase
MAAVHPTALVEDGVQLAGDIEIGPFCTVSGTARLAEGVRLLSHVVVIGNVDIGPRTVVYPNAVLGGEAQIRNASAPEARLAIGADNVIREGVTISAGSRKGGGVTRIGDRNYFMAYSHVGHDCQVGDNVTLSNGVQLGGHSEIANGVILGGLAAVQQFSRVGQYAFISGLSGVNADVIPYGMALGMHARLGGLNLIGLKRSGVLRANIHALRAAFRAIFLERTGNVQERAARAAETWADVPEVQHVTAFVLADAKRQIARARVRGSAEDESA